MALDIDRIRDITDVLDEVRSWSGINERSPGTLYLKGKPFLHFHAGRDSRRADIRGADGWIQLDLPEPASAQVRRRLLSVLKAEYAVR